MGIERVLRPIEPTQEEVKVIENNNLILLDGRKIELYPKAEKSEEKISGKMSLDTTGEYLSLKDKKSEVNYDSEKETERQYTFQIFTENAWFFLEHAEEILSDSRLFLAPVKIQNGLAYFGTNGFIKPALGVYLEWWLNYKSGRDKNGNLIYYISGSPLSGSNCCMSVAPDGEHVDCRHDIYFGDVWRGFIEENNRYNDAKVNYEAYSLEEALIKMHGEDYRFRIQQMKYEAREKVLKWERNGLLSKVKNLREKLSDNIVKNKQLELRHNADSIKKFVEEYNEKTKAFNKIHGHYVQERTELKRLYHSGHIECDYRTKLTEISKPMRDAKHELSVMANQFMRKTFGKNPNGINLQDVLKFAKQHLQ